MAPRLVSWDRVSSFCSQDVTDCFILVCAANGLYSQLFLKGYREKESSGPHSASQSYDWFQHCGQEVMNHLPFTSDFHPFGPLKKHLVMKQFPANANVEKPVIFCLQTLDTIVPGHKPWCYSGTNNKFAVVTT